MVYLIFKGTKYASDTHNPHKTYTADLLMHKRENEDVLPEKEICVKKKNMALK